ncbi:hypothetical protein GH714_039003 [Hevea brasiliensis]|uniref:Retrotransposon gag domain-containing protein n=1 Tax=Hevea brasiliensis TaxID=3981 RepID=A0A6A6K8T8_HEVBR|nr:hypothetical protein GH714_039003 [Hevea brasiliensis]
MRANPYERLATVYQEKFVDEYIDVFVALTSQAEGLTDQQYLGFFLSGLREEIRVRIRSQDSIDLFCTMNLAREIELEIQFLTSKLSLKHGGDSSQRWGSVIGPGPRNDMGRVQSMGVCHDVKINLGNLEISVDCYVFPLGGVDLILGVAWLATLGNPSYTKMEISIFQLSKLIDVEFSMLLWELSSLEHSYNFDAEITLSQ